MPDEIPTLASYAAKNSGVRQVFLPSEAFKGILRYPGRVERLSAGVVEGAWCRAQNCMVYARKFALPALNRLWFRRDKPYEPIVECEFCSL
jgi:hypothetical protein